MIYELLCSYQKDLYRLNTLEVKVHEFAASWGIFELVGFYKFLKT